MITVAGSDVDSTWSEEAMRCTRIARSRGVAPRELQVLLALMEGLSEAAIADRFSISRHTVHAHVRNLYLKLGVHNRVQLFRQVMLED